MKGTLQCGTVVVLVEPDLSYRYWNVFIIQFILCVYIPLVICVYLGQFLAFLDVLVGSS